MKNIFIFHNISKLETLLPINKRIFVIIDNKLKHYYHFFKKYDIIEIETSEKLKNFNSIEKIIEKLLEEEADRNSFLLGVGGGITTDICGFCASIYKRGIDFGFVPTTLLAQCDASIGGKNGVNFNYLKNIIGTINQPSFVFIDTEFLITLPPQEIKNGAAEIIKTAILFDSTLYKEVIEWFGNFNTNGNKLENIEVLNQIIEKCARYKSAIIEKDPYEKEERRLLNLGHTIGHAIEKVATEEGKKVSHGEAVAIGIVIAAKIAEKITPKQIASGLSERFSSDLHKMGLPVSYINSEKEKIITALLNDKKIADDKIHFILPVDIGKAEDKMIELNKLEEILRDLQ